MQFEIVTDSSANLRDSDIKKNGLTVIPFSYIENGCEYPCPSEGEFDGTAFYGNIRNGSNISTSMVNSEAYYRCFKEMLANGKDVLYVGMSSGISGAYAASTSAAEELRTEFSERTLLTFDTLAASLGEGLQVLRACELRDAGVPIQEVFDKLTGERKEMRQLFTVDDLMHLYRGGRVSKVNALIGTLLKIKPLLTGDCEGKIRVYGRMRGMNSAIKELAEGYRGAVQPEKQIVGIAHADAPEMAAKLAELLKEIAAPVEIIMVCYEPVTGAHVGPGAVALFFRGENLTGIK